MHGWTLYHSDNKGLWNPNWALQIGWHSWETIPNEPLVKSWAKCFPSILKWIQFGVEVIWIYGFDNTIFIKVGNSRPVDISDEESFLSAIFRPVFGRRSASFDSPCFIKWRTHINLHKPGIIVFNPVKIADSKSTPMKLIFFRFGFSDRISSPNLLNVFSTLVKCSIIRPRWTGAHPSMVFTRRLFL